MFAQWWGDVLVQSAIFVQRFVSGDSEAFQSPTTAQTQTLAAIFIFGQSGVQRQE